MRILRKDEKERKAEIDVMNICTSHHTDSEKDAHFTVIKLKPKADNPGNSLLLDIPSSKSNSPLGKVETNPAG